MTILTTATVGMLVLAWGLFSILVLRDQHAAELDDCWTTLTREALAAKQRTEAAERELHVVEETRKGELTFLGGLMRYLGHDHYEITDQLLRREKPAAVYRRPDSLTWGAVRRSAG